MSETLQSHNISLHPNMREWVKEQVAKTYAKTQEELQTIKTSIANQSLEKELTMTNVLDVLKDAKSRMETKKTTFGIFNEMGAGLVLSIQIALKKLGYNPGVIDGIYKNKDATTKSNTQLAVEAFQSANGLSVDGVAGPLTLEKLVGAFESSLTGKPIVFTKEEKIEKEVEEEKIEKEVEEEQIEKEVEEEKIEKEVKEEQIEKEVKEEKIEKEVKEEQIEKEVEEEQIEKEVEEEKIEKEVKEEKIEKEVEEEKIEKEVKEEQIEKEVEEEKIEKEVEEEKIEKGIIPEITPIDDKNIVPINSETLINQMGKISSLLNTYLSDKDTSYYVSLLKDKIDKGNITIDVVEKELETIIDESIEKNFSKEKITGKLLLKIYLLIQESPDIVRNKAASLLEELGEIRRKYYNYTEKKQYPTTDPKDIERASYLTQEINSLVDIYEQLQSKKVS